MMRQWESLTPEQQEKLREKMRDRFGDWPRPGCGWGDASPSEKQQPGAEGPRPTA